MGLLGRNAKAVEYNHVLKALRKKMIEADKNYDSKTRDTIAAQIKGMSAPFAALLEIDTINTIFYLNYNEKMAIRGLKERSNEDKIKLFTKILHVDLKNSEDKQEFVDFISWACGIYDDKLMSKLIQHLCDNINIDDSQKLFELTSIIDTTYLEKCKKILKNTKADLKNRKTPGKFTGMYL